MTREDAANAGGKRVSPRVSVVTPFYNTATYLAECIESVLAQTYADFEYLLVNNRSTDGSREIAARYATLDPRITLIDNALFVDQVTNYNDALQRIDPRSQYCKLVQADDRLLPDCLRLMVEVAERNPRIGLVSSYYLEGNRRLGDGLPKETWRVDGREACRMMLRHGYFFVGSPTSVLYRADVVRSRTPFYSVGRYHEDTEAAYEILLEHDLGFVHQVLTFLRTENESISSATRAFNPDILDALIVVERYGPFVLDQDELVPARDRARQDYYRFLGRSAFHRWDPAFWAYHRRGLASIGRELHWTDVLPNAVSEAVRLATAPRRTLKEVRLRRMSRAIDPARGESRSGG